MKTGSAGTTILTPACFTAKSAFSLRTLLQVGLLIASLPRSTQAQRPATPDDFPGLTSCDDGKPTTRIRADITDSMQLTQLRVHEAVHRLQAKAFPTCESFMASLTSARRIIDVELPAYCAQWRVAVAQGANPAETRREFAWRIAAQSGAMENRLQAAQRLEEECPLNPQSTRPALRTLLRTPPVRAVTRHSGDHLATPSQSILPRCLPRHRARCEAIIGRAFRLGRRRIRCRRKRPSVEFMRRCWPTRRGE